MGIKEKFSQLKLDIDYVEKQYGQLNNKQYTVEDFFERMLASPNTQTAFDVMFEMLWELYQTGYVAEVGTMGKTVIKPLPMFDDENLRIICERWSLPIPEIE